MDARVHEILALYHLLEAEDREEVSCRIRDKRLARTARINALADELGLERTAPVPDFPEVEVGDLGPSAGYAWRRSLDEAT